MLHSKKQISLFILTISISPISRPGTEWKGAVFFHHMVHYWVHLMHKNTDNLFDWSIFLCKTYIFCQRSLFTEKITCGWNEMWMSKWRQIVHFGVKSFQSWYVNKAFSQINHPYQHTTESTEQIWTTQLKGHCQCFSTHGIKRTTISAPSWHLLSCWGFMISNVWYIKTHTFTKLHDKARQSHTMECSDYFRKHTKLPSHTKVEERKGNCTHTHTETHIGLVGKFCKSKWNFIRMHWEVEIREILFQGVTHILTIKCAFWMQSTPEYTVHLWVLLKQWFLRP